MDVKVTQPEKNWWKVSDISGSHWNFHQVIWGCSLVIILDLRLIKVWKHGCLKEVEIKREGSDGDQCHLIIFFVFYLSLWADLSLNVLVWWGRWMRIGSSGEDQHPPKAPSSVYLYGWCRSNWTCLEPYSVWFVTWEDGCEPFYHTHFSSSLTLSSFPLPRRCVRELHSHTLRIYGAPLWRNCSIGDG